MSGYGANLFLLYKHALSRELDDLSPLFLSRVGNPHPFFRFTRRTIQTQPTHPCCRLGRSQQEDWVFLGLRQSRVTPLVFRVRLIAHVSLFISFVAMDASSVVL